MVGDGLQWGNAMEGKKTLGKIAVEEVDVAGEDGGVARGITMEAMEVVGEGDGIIEVNAAEGELTTRSTTLKKNT